MVFLPATGASLESAMLAGRPCCQAGAAAWGAGVAIGAGAGTGAAAGWAAETCGAGAVACVAGGSDVAQALSRLASSAPARMVYRVMGRVSVEKLWLLCIDHLKSYAGPRVHRLGFPPGLHAVKALSDISRIYERSPGLSLPATE
ncbi:hypothetical protein GCM10027399_13700 [Curvibacter fontanus]